MSTPASEEASPDRKRRGFQLPVCERACPTRVWAIDYCFDQTSDLRTLKILAEDFRIDYNSYRPHSSLGYKAPAAFAEQLLLNQAGPSVGVDS